MMLITLLLLTLTLSTLTWVLWLKLYLVPREADEAVVTFLDKVCQVELEKYIESSYEELAFT